MNKIIVSIFVLISFSCWGQSSMRRCTLLPVTDSVGGAIGFKVFQEVEQQLKRSNWCTYVSNSGLINVFSKYRDNLPQYLKTKEVLKTVAEKLKVGSIVRVGIVNEVKGVELEMEVYGENGEDLYFSEKTILNKDDIELITSSTKSWLEVYSKMIPYDAKINGILGDQLTLDVGKGYPISSGQKFIVKRLISKKKHPLFKKVVDWETEVLAEGSIFSISDNQALGMIKVYKADKKLSQGDWVRLEAFRQDVIEDPSLVEKETLGTLGIVSMALNGSNSSVDSSSAAGSNTFAGRMLGVNLRAEGWITRQYFVAFEVDRTAGTLKKSSGVTSKKELSPNYMTYKATGGFKFLPIGFFYGPQIDIYGGYANYNLDLGSTGSAGLEVSKLSGLLFGLAANVPINRDYRVFTRAEFLPTIIGDNGNTALELELGLKYYYTLRMSIDGSLKTTSRKSSSKDSATDTTYKDNSLKLGISYNF